MIVPRVHFPRPTRRAALVRSLAVATAALFAIDAYVHFNDAGLYDIGSGGSITEGSLFRGQASVAVVVAITLLIRPHWLVWAIAVLVAAGAAGAVYLYTYVDVGRVGPLPNMYEPTWALPGKRASAVAEAVATATALAGMLAAVYARPSKRSTLRQPAVYRARR
jgi:hypothetical protein